jgi:4-amino-4-deoxy-L-arabinose transferase-like glycosyltransferase
MIIKINQKEFSVTWLTVAHIFILLFFVFYTFRDLSYNTAFVDEAIYATVGEEVLRGIYWESALSWMGGSYLYPIISALINHSLGLSGIRIFSALCMFWTGIIAGKIGNKLSGVKGEVIATGLFFSSSMALDLAQMGTYDAPSLLFLALSFYTLVFATEKSATKGIILLVLSAILFTISVLIKYVAILFVPIFVLTILLSTKTKYIQNIVVWFSVFLSILGIYVVNTFESLRDYFTSTAFSEPTSQIKIVFSILTLLNIFAFGAIATLIILLIRKPKYRWLIVCLLLAGLVLPSYHIIFANFRAIWKHMAFASFFWAPITAWILLKGFRLSESFSGKRVLITNISQFVMSLCVVAITTYLWINLSSHWRFQRSWPSANKSIEYLRAYRNENDRIFAEGSAVYKYHLFSGFEDPSSWASTWYFEYKGRTGEAAMKEAIADKHFHFIVFNYYFTNDLNQVLLPVIKENYTIAITDTFKISGVYDNDTEVWIPKQ